MSKAIGQSVIDNIITDVRLYMYSCNGKVDGDKIIHWHLSHMKHKVAKKIKWIEKINLKNGC